MRSLTFVLICLLSCKMVSAQDATVKDLKTSAEMKVKKQENDSIPKAWKAGGNFNVTVNQGSLSNWSAGGDKFSFSLNSSVSLFAFLKKNKHSWDNSLDLAYGIVKTTSLGNRKSSDRIDLLTKYGYAIGKNVNVSGLFNLRSQFAKGFSYSKNSLNQDSSTLTSKTFAPAYLLLSIGIDWKPVRDLSLFISPLTERWTLVGDTNLGTLYGLEPGKRSRNELGAYFSVNYLLKNSKNFTFKTKLDLFSNYKHDPQDIDVFWSNIVTAKITKYINFSFNLDMIYDNDVKNIDPLKGPAPQWLELMGLGFAYTFKK